MGCTDRQWQTTDSQRRNTPGNDYRPRSIYRWEPDRVYTRAMRERGERPPTAPAAAPAPAGKGRGGAGRGSLLASRAERRSAAGRYTEARSRPDERRREQEAERQKKANLLQLPYQVPNDFFNGGAGLQPEQRVRQPETSAESLVRYALEALGVSPATAVSTPMTTSSAPTPQPTNPNTMPFPKIYLIDGSNVFHSMLIDNSDNVKAINRVSYFPNNPEKSIAHYFRRRTLTRNAFFHMSKYGEQQTTQNGGGPTQWRDLNPAPTAASTKLLSEYRVNIRSTIADVLNGDNADEMRIGLDGFVENRVADQEHSEPSLTMQAPVIIVFNEKSYHLLVDSTAAHTDWDIHNAEQYRSWGFTVSPPGFENDRCPAGKRFDRAARQSIFHMPRDDKGVSMFYRVLEATAVMHNWTYPVVFVPIHAEQQTAAKARDDARYGNQRAKLIKYEQRDLLGHSSARKLRVDDRETSNDKAILRDNESKCEFLLPSRDSNAVKEGTSLSHGWCEWDDCIISRMRDHLDELGFSVDCISSDTNLYKTDAPFADGDLPDYDLPSPGNAVEKNRATALYDPRTEHGYTGPDTRARTGSRPLLYPAIARKHFFDEFEEHLGAVVTDLAPTSLGSRYSSARTTNGYTTNGFTTGPNPDAETYMQAFRIKMPRAWSEAQAVRGWDVSDAGDNCETNVALPLKFRFQLPRKQCLATFPPGQSVAFTDNIVQDEQVVHIYGNADRALYYLALLSQSESVATAVDGSVLKLDNPMLADYSPDPYPQKYLLPGYTNVSGSNPGNLRQPEPYYNTKVGPYNEVDVGGEPNPRSPQSMRTQMMRIRTWVLQYWMRTHEPGLKYGEGHGVKGADFRQDEVAIQQHRDPRGYEIQTDFRSEISPRDILAFAQGFTVFGSTLERNSGSRFEYCLLLQHELLRDRLVMLRDAANYLQLKHRAAADSDPNKAIFRNRFWEAVQIANKECSMLKLDALRDAATVQSGGKSAEARIRLQQETAELQTWLAVRRWQPLPHTRMTGATNEPREFLRSSGGTSLANSADALGKFNLDQRRAFLANQYNRDRVTRDRTQRQNALANHIHQLNQLVIADNQAMTFDNQMQYIRRLTGEEKNTLFEARKEHSGIGNPTRIH